MQGRLRAALFSVLALGMAAALLSGCSSDARNRGQSQAGRVATRSGDPKPRFDSIADAVDYVGGRVDVNVVLPRGLPVGTRLASASVSVLQRKDMPASGQIHLTLPGGRDLTLEYGAATFDGCGPLHPQDVRVGKAPAVLDVDRSGGRTFSTVVWPATRQDLTGRYGISGEIGPRQALDFARSMASMHAQGVATARAGC